MAHLEKRLTVSTQILAESPNPLYLELVPKSEKSERWGGKLIFFLVDLGWNAPLTTVLIGPE